MGIVGTGDKLGLVGFPSLQNLYHACYRICREQKNYPYRALNHIDRGPHEYKGALPLSL
jgi:hypothetical protein